MGDVRKIYYLNKDSKDYIRAYSNQSIFQVNPQEDAVIDFYEQYAEPLHLLRQVFDEEGNVIEAEFSSEPGKLNVYRERKCTVTLTKDQAIQLANLILSTYEEEE